MSSQNSLSIGVLYFDTPDERFNETITSTIAAVKKAKQMGLLNTCTIYLLDNSLKEKPLIEELANKIKSAGIKFRFVRNKKNIGFARAHNIAILKSKDDFHLVLNPDVKLDPSAIAEGVKFLEENIDCSIVSPNGRSEDGENLFLAKSYPSLLILFLRAIRGRKDVFAGFLSQYECHYLYQKESPEKILLASGCFMLCRLKDLKNIGGFDERFFLYFEDFDLSLRIRSEGNVYWLPSMLIFHSGGHTISKGFWHIFLFLVAGARFFSSHGWKVI